jgi:putative transposase
MHRMETVNRKVTYRLYPTAKQETAMLAIKRGHQQLYNAALEQRRAAWSRQRHSVTRTAQEKDLTALRANDDAIRQLNAQASQLTLRRLDLAFQAFFRRVKAGETPGYPRFKSLKRFKGGDTKPMAMAGGWTLGRRCSMGICGCKASARCASVAAAGRQARPRPATLPTDTGSGTSR